MRLGFQGPCHTIVINVVHPFLSHDPCYMDIRVETFSPFPTRTDIYELRTTSSVVSHPTLHFDTDILQSYDHTFSPPTNPRSTMYVLSLLNCLVLDSLRMTSVLLCDVHTLSSTQRSPWVCTHLVITVPDKSPWSVTVTVNRHF